MSFLYDPKERGFPEALCTIDRCQVALIRELANSTDCRLVLKGGMAMRVAVGSWRLTKDVDFDRTSDMSITSAQGSVKRALTYAAQSAGLRGARIDTGKSTPTTLRMRLAGIVAGEAVRFVVEISGRDPVAPKDQTRVRVEVPARYGIAPFVVSTYTHEMLAASKVLAVMSANRNVPRDVYDLSELLGQNASPILAARVSSEHLRDIAANTAGRSS
jgi:predicted nucleotidyltransferase component of viral defense system